MNKNWITIKEAAVICNSSYEALKKAVQRGNIISKRVEGKGNGGQLRILLESLPQEAQERYNGVEPKLPARNTVNEYEALTNSEREKTQLKIFVVNEYLSFKNWFVGRDCRKEFIKKFVDDYPDYELEVSPDNLDRWVKKYKSDGFMGLVDRRGKSTKGTTSLTQDMQDRFLYEYLNDSQPHISVCYDIVKKYYEMQGVTVPSISSFKRFLKTVPQSTIVYYRKGVKAFNDYCTASIPTDYKKNLFSNDEWVADHHVFDVLVNDNGKVGRAWLSVWFDRRSRCILGYVVNLCDPNADIVLDSFYDSVKKYGVPRRVQIDNGKDYKAHDLFNLENSYALANVMSMAVRTSIKYNAKAKPVERVFRTLELRNRLLPSYIGDRPDNRPESMKKLNKDIADELMTYSDFRKYVDNNIKIYNNTPHSGKGMDGRTPKEVYENSFNGAVKIIADDELQVIMRRTTKCAKVSKNGVKFNELYNQEYNSDELQILAFGKMVYARYDTADVRKIHIYLETGEFLCVAGLYGHNDYGNGREITSQVIREYANHNKKVRAAAKAGKPVVNDMNVPQILDDYARGLENPNIMDLPKEIHLDRQKRDELEQVKQAEKRFDRNAPTNEKSPKSTYDDGEQAILLGLGNNKAI